MEEVKTKKLIEYDMHRILSRIEKEFGKIERGTEDNYNPQLHYIEREIFNIYQEIPISDYELQDVILMIIYDLKSYIDNINYDYSSIRDYNLIVFSKSLEMLFDPFLNDEIIINDDAKKDLKGLFTLPIICLDRLYYSIDFWREYYGKNGYFKMLEEMVMPYIMLGKFPYALDEKYLV